MAPSVDSQITQNTLALISCDLTTLERGEVKKVVWISPVPQDMFKDTRIKERMKPLTEV